MNDLSPVVNNNSTLSSSRSGLPNSSTQAAATALQQANESVKLEAKRPVEQSNRAASEASVKQAIDDVNRFLESQDRSLRFSLDDDSGRTVVKVIDQSTEEVVRSFPSEEVLSVSKFIQENIDRLGQEVEAGILLQVEG